MPNTQDQGQTEKGLFALFKGASGMGKTVGAISFPTPYVFDFDKKFPAIALKHFPNKPIEYDQFEDIDPLITKLQSFLGAGSCPYETIIFDSVTSLVNLIISSLAKVKGEALIDVLRRNQKTSGNKNQIEMLGIDYYSGETRFFDWLMSISKTLWTQPGNPKNVIFVAHVITVDSAPDLKTKVVTRTRSIVTAGRKVAAFIPTQFDEVYMFGHTEEVGMVDNNGRVEPTRIKRIVSTENTGEDDAKTAYRLQKTIDFTDKNLYDLILAQIKGQFLFK